MDSPKRRYPRAHYGGWVEIASGDGRRVARGRDLCASGLGVSMTAPHPAAGELIESEFSLPGLALPVAAAARVVWSDPGSGVLGLHFTRLDPAVAELLENFVEGWL